MIPLTTIFNIKSTIISQPYTFEHFCRLYLILINILEVFDADSA